MSAQAETHSVEVHPGSNTSVRLSVRAIVLLFVACAVMLLGIAPLRGYLDERSQLADLRHQATQLESENTKLQTRITQLSDPAYLERLARQCLGMVKPGETAFVIVPKHGSPTPPDC
jgi:cell division protein FtsB